MEAIMSSDELLRDYRPCHSVHGAMMKGGRGQIPPTFRICVRVPSLHRLLAAYPASVNQFFLLFLSFNSFPPTVTLVRQNVKKKSIIVFIFFFFCFCCNGNLSLESSPILGSGSFIISFFVLGLSVIYIFVVILVPSSVTREVLSKGRFLTDMICMHLET